MKPVFRLLFLGIVALFAAACATQASVPTITPIEPTAPIPADAPAAAEAVAVSGKPRFIDSYADW